MNVCWWNSCYEMRKINRPDVGLIGHSWRLSFSGLMSFELLVQNRCNNKIKVWYLITGLAFLYFIILSLYFKLCFYSLKVVPFASKEINFKIRLFLIIIQKIPLTIYGRISGFLLRLLKYRLFNSVSHLDSLY